MIYDNPRAVAEANHLVDLYGDDPKQLKMILSGELNRFFRLGQASIVNPLTIALRNADISTL